MIIISNTYIYIYTYIYINACYRLLPNEYDTWIGIYNNYKQKMNLFYQHASMFMPLFKSISAKVQKFKNVCMVVSYI